MKSQSSPAAPAPATRIVCETKLVLDVVAHIAFQAAEVNREEGTANCKGRTVIIDAAIVRYLGGECERQTDDLDQLAEDVDCYDMDDLALAVAIATDLIAFASK